MFVVTGCKRAKGLNVDNGDFNQSNLILGCFGQYTKKVSHVIQSGNLQRQLHCQGFKSDFSQIQLLNCFQPVVL